MSLIRNANKVVQAIDFTGVQNGSIHPSDIDAVFEFDNELLILMEVKYKGTDIPIGQRLMLERICNSWHTNKSTVLKVEHDYDGNDNIPLDKCYVRKIYYKPTKHWIDIDALPLIDILNKIGKKFNINKCKF